jgi:hypothetical protein
MLLFRSDKQMLLKIAWRVGTLKNFFSLGR